RLASPYTSAVNALILAAVLPIIRIAMRLLQSHRVSLTGLMSIFTIAVKVATGLLFQDARLILVGDSMITGLYGLIMIASVLIGKQLIWALIQNITANNVAISQRITGRWQTSNVRATFTVITAVWGVGLLLEFAVRLLLAYSISPDQFLIISPILRWGTL